MNSRLHVVIGIGAAITLAAYAFMDGSPSPRRSHVGNDPDVATDAQNSRQLTMLRSEIDRLRESHQKLRRDVMDSATTMQRAPIQTDARSGESVHEQAPDQELERLRADAMVQAQMALLEQLSESQPTDPNWSARASSSLQQSVLALDAALGAREVEVTCKTTLCRIDVAFLDLDSAEIGVGRLTLSRPWKTGGFYRIESDTARVTQFVAREGHDLPRPEEYSYAAP